MVRSSVLDFAQEVYQKGFVAQKNIEKHREALTFDVFLCTKVKPAVDDS